MHDEKSLTRQLEEYDLSKIEAQIYLFLLKRGSDWSVVKLSRELGLGRTQIYTALDKLELKGLVKRVLAKNGFNYQATPAENLNYWWQKKKLSLSDLDNQLSPLIAALQSWGMPNGYESKIQYFAGRRGIEQITFNSTRAQRDLYIYEVESDMSAFIDPEMAEEFRRLFVKNQITSHQLTNHTKISNFTTIEKMVTNFWDIRHININDLTIEFEMLIYNDVCALYSFEEADAFGVEIHNPNLARMQKQIFLAMQKLALPMQKIGSNGQAMLPKRRMA